MLVQLIASLAIALSAATAHGAESRPAAKSASESSSAGLAAMQTLPSAARRHVDAKGVDFAMRFPLL